MTSDLDDEIYAVLHSPPGYTPRALDLDVVIASGGRLRRRRRLALVATTAAALAVIAAGSVIGLSHPSTIVSPAASPTPTVATSLPAPVNGRIGAVIATGVTASAGKQWVLFFVPFTYPGNNGTTIGLTISERSPDGTIASGGLTIAEYQGSDRAVGFHPMQAAMTLEGGVIQPAFGYYIGRPTTITAVIGGHTSTAHQATWSADPNVTVFWFDPDDGALSDLGAYDSTGTRMPDGHIKIDTN